ncbi:unnamed protein product [Ectocarpus sp. 4 AP-2014]
MDGGAKAAGGGAEVVFRKVAAGESRLWETKRIQHADLNRLHLRSIESILDPTVSADSIIGAVAYAVTSHGLRVTQREQGRIVAQRVEAPYLASVSSGSWRSGSGQEREEWRMVVANLGVSKGVGEGKMVERVLSVSFMTDPVPKPTDLAGKGVAAVTSLLGSVGSVASTFSSSMTTSSKDGPTGSSAGSAGAAAGKAGAASGAASSLTAVEIANVRSNQRADSLLQAVVAELGRIGWQGAVDRRTGTAAAASAAAAAAAAVVGPRGTKPSTGSPPPEQQKAAEKGEDAGDGARPGERAASMLQEVLVLAPFDGSGSSSSASGSVASASALGPLSPEEEGREGEKAEGPPRQEEDQETGVPEGGVATAGAGADAGVAAAAATVVEVGLCLQFVEGLCARAEEYSRHDAAETWRPLQDTVSRLERDNATLRSLLEPKYRAVGAAPPPVPIWSGRRSFGETYGSSVGSAATNVGNAPSKRVVELLRSTPLFVIEGKQVKAKVVSGAAAAAAAASGSAKRDGERQSDGSSSAPGSAAADLGGSRGHALLVRAAVKALTEVVGRVCESREEAFLKARLPGAQAYTVELERYGSTIAGGSALRATASFPEGDWASGGSVEVDDDLWRLFAAQETRLYSSSAALGKKPGRLYVTYSTLWFHSKVLGFESRHVLPLAEVVSITLLGAALDLSSSLVIATNSGGVPGELMFIFPGQKRRQVQPLEVLLRQLAVLAAKERAAATAEATEATGTASADVSS